MNRLSDEEKVLQDMAFDFAVNHSHASVARKLAEAMRENERYKQFFDQCIKKAPYHSEAWRGVLEVCERVFGEENPNKDSVPQVSSCYQCGERGVLHFDGCPTQNSATDYIKSTADGFVAVHHKCIHADCVLCTKTTD